MTSNDLLNSNLDSQSWHTCAGPLVRLPPLNSAVYYFPQGHAANANSSFNFAAGSQLLPPLFRCRLANLRLSADPETDEVFATMSLVPDAFYGGLENGGGENAAVTEEVTCSKVLTQSDANNGGGFSVPKACADTIFPPLDYTIDPPVQVINAVDVHGKEWKFRHIFRGTPRRHLLTSGWSVFVNEKSLIAGDCIIFSRTAGGGIGVRIRRVRRSRGKDAGRVTQEDVAGAVALAAAGKPFEVVYDPCGGAAEFVVRAEAVETAARMAHGALLLPGVKIKMDFEDADDPTQKKTSLGTVESLQAFDAFYWPTSPWRMVQVRWDTEAVEAHMQETTVNPWSISVESNSVQAPEFSGIVPLPAAIQADPGQSEHHHAPDHNYYYHYYSAAAAAAATAVVPYCPVDLPAAAATATAEEDDRLPDATPGPSVTCDTNEKKTVLLFGVNIATPPPSPPPPQEEPTPNAVATDTESNGVNNDTSSIIPPSLPRTKKRSRKVLDSILDDINERRKR